MNTYWDALKTAEFKPLEEVPKHLRMKLYGLVRKFTWEFIKAHVITNKMKLEIPNNVDDPKLLEYSATFKEELLGGLKEIFASPPLQMYEIFDEPFG